MLTNHLKDSGLTYLQHMRRALLISHALVMAAVTCFIHAFLPFVFESNASSTIKNLYKRLEI